MQVRVKFGRLRVERSVSSRTNQDDEENERLEAHSNKLAARPADQLCVCVCVYVCKVWAACEHRRAERSRAPREILA